MSEQMKPSALRVNNNNAADRDTASAIEPADGGREGVSAEAFVRANPSGSQL